MHRVQPAGTRRNPAPLVARVLAVVMCLLVLPTRAVADNGSSESDGWGEVAAAAAASAAAAAAAAATRSRRRGPPRWRPPTPNYGPDGIPATHDDAPGWIPPGMSLPPEHFAPKGPADDALQNALQSARREARWKNLFRK